MIRLFQLALVAIAFIMLAPPPSHAQISNQPFSFGNGSDGLGMSDAGRQAIINQKILGATPEVLLKDQLGRPLGVTKGPSGIAIVTGPSGEQLPGYRGQGWKGSNSERSAGVFNAYFMRGRQDGPPITVASTSGQAVDAWTNAVQYGPAAYGSSVDQWVAMAYYLGPP